MYTFSVDGSREFDWDQHNERHFEKRGISRADAEDVLTGNHVLLEFQAEENEPRWISVGATRAGRILNIVFAVRGDAIRPITGWVADKETAAIFAREWGRE